jgi:DNA-binding phage protein
MEVSPKINIDMKQTTQISIANDISNISSFLEKIIDECDDNIIKAYLADVKNKVHNLSSIEDKIKMKESSSLSKIKTLVEDANKMGSSLNTFLNNVSNGFETMQKIGIKYNSIAEWCGAPQIPSLFLK